MMQYKEHNTGVANKFDLQHEIVLTQKINGTNCKKFLQVRGEGRGGGNGGSDERFSNETSGTKERKKNIIARDNIEKDQVRWEKT